MITICRFFPRCANFGILVLALLSVDLRAASDALYQPGQVRGGGIPLDPPTQTDPDYWQVTDSIRLGHFDAGSGGTDVLVLHGGPGIPPSAPWSVVSHLNGRARFRFYHQRGCGDSTRPIDGPADPVTAERALGLGAQIADVERIRRLGGDRQLVLLGHSYGAVIASLYAAEFPERVRGLILISPAAMMVSPGAPESNLYELVAARLSGKARGEFAAYLKEMFDFPANFNKRESELSALYARFRKYYDLASGTTAPASDPARVGGWMTLANYLSLGRERDYRPALAAVTAPVLVVHGERDITPVSVSQAFAGYFKDAKLVQIPNAGHFSFEENPAALAEAIGSFLDRLP